jgi:acetyl-CoA acetyltransferase
MCGLYMAQTAERCAAPLRDFTTEQDAYAVRSSSAQADAWEAGRLAEEVVPVEIKTRKGVRESRAR